MELLKFVLDQLPVGVLRVGLDGRIVDANAEALRLLGYGALEQVAGKSARDFEGVLLREDGTPWPLSELPLVRALETGEPQAPSIFGVRRPDGETSWAIGRTLPAREVGGRLTGVLITTSDITERKRAEEALRQSEAAWRSLAENHPDVVTILDRDARLVSMNRSSGASVLGMPAYAFVHPDHVDDWRARFGAVLEGRTSPALEVRARGPDSSYVWYETRFVPLPDENGRVERVLLVAHEITEQRAMVAQLAEKERLASIGMLSASVAHEIMNPLTSVLAHLDFAMSDRCPPGARRMKELRDAREVAGRMQQIVRDLRTLGRRETEEFFYVDVRSVIETALRLAGPVVNRNVALRVELTDVPDVLAGESRLCQVLINLLLNAAQSVSERTDGESSIVVRTRADDVAGLVGIDVADTGMGIAPEHLPRIFEPFFTTKPSGTGLGLSIAKASMERMGGRLEVESRPGIGATFTVWLPTMRAPAAKG